MAGTAFSVRLQLRRAAIRLSLPRARVILPVAALIGLVLFVLLGIVHPYDPLVLYTVPPNQTPSLTFPFGTTALGQDLFWLLTVALRNSLIIGFIAVIFGRSLAVLVGSAAGFLGGVVDRGLSAITDTMIVIPRFPLLLLVTFIVKGQLTMATLGLLIGLLDWAWPSKRYRSLLLSLREEPFTQTALFSGMPLWRIFWHEYLPFLLPFLLADATSGFLYATGMEITLAIIGLTNVQIPTLGTTLYWAIYYQAFITGEWWWVFFPVSAVILVVVTLYSLATLSTVTREPQMLSVARLEAEE